MRSEEVYAKLARDYAEKVAQAARDPQRMWPDGETCHSQKMRDMLHEARRLGLLSSTGRGRSGGGLTPKAVAILNAGEMND